MEEHDFQLKVIEDLAVMRNDIKHIRLSIPCEKIRFVDKAVKLNRGLIFLLFTSYIGLVTYMIQR